MEDNNLNQEQNYQPVTPQPGQRFQPDSPETIKPQKKSKKKLILIVLLLVLLLAGGATAAYFLLFKKDAVAPAAQTSNQEQPTPSGPAALLYVPQAQGNSPQTIHQLSLENNTSKQVLELAQGEKVAESVVRGSSAAVVTSLENGQSAVYYTNDNGGTFERIYETTAPANPDTLEDQLTSIALSNDGSRVVIGLLRAENRKNTVTEIYPGTKKTNELFTSDDAGVFIYAYNTDTTVIYTKGCYNCGGNLKNDILAYNIKDKQEKTLVTTQNSIDKISVNNEFTKLLYAEVPLVIDEEEFGFINTGPYTVKEFDLADTQTKELLSFGEARKLVVNLEIGYMSDGTTPFYVDGNKINSLGSEQPIMLFESTQNAIQSAYYVSNDVLYFSLGEQNPVLTYRYTSNDKSLTELIKDEKPLRVLGVTANN